MAQTGLSSAVGLCLEDTWRRAPLTNLSGSNYAIGVSNINPHRFWVLEPGGGLPAKPEIVVADNEIDGDVQTSRTMKTAVTYDGEFSWKGDGENLYYPLLGIMGRDVQTTIQAAGSVITAGVFSHKLLPSKYAPSFTCEEIFGDATYGRASTGVVVQHVELDFAKIVMAKAKLIPYRQVPNQYSNAANALTDYNFGATPAIIPRQLSGYYGNATNTWTRTATPGYCDVQQEQPTMKYGTGPFVFANMTYGLQAGNFAGAFMTVDDVPVAVDFLEGCNLTIDRSIKADMTGGSGYDPGACTGSQLTFAGKISILYKDTTIQLAALRHSKFGLNFQIIGVTPGSGGTAYYLIDVYLPNCKFTEPEGPNIVDGPIITGGAFKARRDPTLGYACQITIQNTFDNRTLAGVANLANTTGVVTAATSGVLTNGANFQVNDVVTIAGGAAAQYLVSAVNNITGAYTVNVAFTASALAAVTKVGTGTTLTGATSAGSPTLAVTNNAMFNYGDQILLPGIVIPFIIVGFTGSTGITLNNNVGAVVASGAVVYRPATLQGGLNGWVNV